MPAAPDPGPSDARPIAADELGGLFAAAAGHRRVVLAVSGGSDSMALMALYRAFRNADPTAPEAVVATIDHGLRAEAADDARFVLEAAAACGFAAVTRRWEGDKPAADIQAAARAARYGLLAAVARDAGATAILTAHTLDDQAETVLLRLARGSGVKGLSAMAPVRRLAAGPEGGPSDQDGRRAETSDGGVALVRPLLGVPRARLRATLCRDGIGWRDDPSNENDRFARVRMRRLMPALAAEGLDARRLAATAGRLARADAAIDAMVEALAATALQADAFGVLALDVAAFAAAPEEVRLRLLARMLGWAGGGDVGPRLERLERAAAAIEAGGAARFTLAGALLTLAHGRLVVCREAGRGGLADMALAPGTSGVWDGRWRVRLSDAAPEPVTVRAVGSAWRKLAPPDWRSASAGMAVVPGIFCGEGLVAAPAFGHFAAHEWRGAVAADFATPPPGR
ncbi:tRNA(Ile)-lysidine synthase [Amorphus sp. MBR-141]